MAVTEPGARMNGDYVGRRTSFDTKQQLSEKVAAYVREGIMVGEFRAGEYIRTERLAQELGVSPTPVREALMLLGSEGTVRWEPRRGYRVVPLTPRDVSDLFDVQAFIAGELAARAAEALPDAELDRLEKLQADLEAADRAQLPEEVDRLNFEIHRTINKASDSHRMATLLNLTVSYVPLRFFGTIEGWSSASAHDHAPIFTALRERDTEAARTAMREHIRHIGDLLVSHLKARELLS
ncbi:GntR family transcriptional regulator [Amycolatopsis cynarae]|uniref:GntR family transcriptional regulator n=1 Tax=Amycolatopsis cynarae TaxID=2995223 RepID=A0ABY7B8A7_9PSEU|nr:GntR family transcriptional regulator [Amycolatopsis sp. HUAS 11-8]WAL68376.1 GntR family transcriptional regulator [Amycolatopsis sp. HUAS 11-8]